MYSDKHINRHSLKCGSIVLAAVLFILCCAGGGTIAYLTSQSGTVINTFTSASTGVEIKETCSGAVKSNVYVENTSDIDVFIRAAIIVSWADSSGNVYAQAPTEDDYTIELGSDWKKIDGYYYYSKRVSAKGTDSDKTANLIDRCYPTEGNAPTGCELQVTVLAEAIQADGGAVSDAWGVDPSTLQSTASTSTLE
jgi:hypothetical protein